jgi:DnaJ-class molecular chaperone
VDCVKSTKILKTGAAGIMTLYEILGGKQGKDTDTAGIRSAYRRLAQQHQPDFSGQTGPKEGMSPT